MWTRPSWICGRRGHLSKSLLIALLRMATMSAYITPARIPPLLAANRWKPATRSSTLGGKHTVEAFTENLRGANVGDVKEFPVTYPAEYPQKSLAGKTFSYHVEIQSIKKKVVPLADDELAKSVSEFATWRSCGLSYARTWRRTQSGRRKWAPSRSWREKLLELHQFPVPDVLVETQLDRKIERTLSQLMQQGIDPRQTQVDWKKVREDAPGRKRKRKYGWRWFWPGWPRPRR